MTQIARVVTDVTGVDKVFDYRIPDHISPSVSVGCRVRVDLNSRRVGAWVIAILDIESASVDPSKLSEIHAYSGHGVDSELVSLCEWTAQRWCGPLRSVLVSASAPRVSELVGQPQRNGIDTTADDSITDAARELLDNGGGLIIVPPLQSALNVVVTAATRGPVLALCPTKRMAFLGASRLRKRGLVVAVMPDDWSRAAGGVDVVIGTRSAVWSPCPNLGSIVVIDSHDDAFVEERSPTWNAVDVARERARRSNVPCIETSATPSLASLWNSPKVLTPHFASRETAEPATNSSGQGSDGLWPRIVVEDLLDQPLNGTFVTSSLVSSLRDPSLTVLSVLNVKGRARMLACKSCAHLALCGACSAAVSLNSRDDFFCGMCEATTEKICRSCGRTDFKLVRRGVTQLRDEFAAAAQREVVEIGVESKIDQLDSAHCYIGTEAALHRVSSADVVCLLDFDDELMSPRLSALNDALSLLVRATRVAGRHGTLIVQTREIDHPLIAALRSATGLAVQEEILKVLRNELERRKTLSLSPTTQYAVLNGVAHDPVPELGISVARLNETSVAVRAETSELLADFVARVRSRDASRVKAYVNPSRV